jgi:hypothetical protein
VSRSCLDSPASRSTLASSRRTVACRSSVCSLSISDLSPLDIAGNFEEAAKKNGETVTVKPYAPTPRARLLTRPGSSTRVRVHGDSAADQSTRFYIGPLALTVAPQIRVGDRSGRRPHRHLRAQRAALRLVLDRMANHGSHHPECLPHRRCAATCCWSPRDLPHRDGGHPIRQPLIGRSERDPLPTRVLESNRPIPAAPRRLSAPAKYGLLRRTRHRQATRSTCSPTQSSPKRSLSSLTGPSTDRSVPGIEDADGAAVLAPVGPPP